MSSFMDVYQRIQLATNTRTQNELAKILEVRQSSISDAKRRDAIPPGWYMTLFEKFGLSQDWLRYGTGPMYLRTEQGYVPQGNTDGEKDKIAYYGEPAAKSSVVTVYSMHCEAGVMERAPELKVAGRLALPSSLVKPDTLVLRMQANNMAPTVQRGAYIGVDTTDTQPLSGGVFVLKDHHENMLVRRIFMDCGSLHRFLLRSDNEKHPESTLQPEEVSERIVGRVSWVLQEIAC